jgi:hypothetical protein
MHMQCCKTKAISFLQATNRRSLQSAEIARSNRLNKKGLLCEHAALHRRRSTVDSGSITAVRLIKTWAQPVMPRKSRSNYPVTELTQAGREALAQIASRHGVSAEAVEHLLMALVAGQGTQAQFNHPEFGGMGQWSMGGMTMVGDMFNNALKARVDAICNDVAQLMQQSSPLHVPPASASQTQSQGDRVSLFVSGGTTGNWWPEDLGHPASTGAQNQMRYAWFPDTARLAIDTGDGRIRIYDTAGHNIGGFSQQQSGDQSLSFTSQQGLVKISELREVKTESPSVSVSGSLRVDADRVVSDPLAVAVVEGATENAVDTQPAPGALAPAQPDRPHPATPAMSQPVEESDIFEKIERLAVLHAKGILTDAEYQSKKAELLARI